jgi:hypothetical protein
MARLEPSQPGPTLLSPHFFLYRLDTNVFEVQGRRDKRIQPSDMSRIPRMASTLGRNHSTQGLIYLVKGKGVSHLLFAAIGVESHA